jgi:uncharacterized protein YjbJ (UPF0337 family)
MSSPRIKGHVQESAGRIKEVAGKLAGTKRLEEEGKFEKLA